MIYLELPPQKNQIDHKQGFRGGGGQKGHFMIYLLVLGYCCEKVSFFFVLFFLRCVLFASFVLLLFWCFSFSVFVVVLGLGFSLLLGQHNNTSQNKKGKTRRTKICFSRVWGAFGGTALPKLQAIRNKTTKQIRNNSSLVLVSLPFFHAFSLLPFFYLSFFSLSPLCLSFFRFSSRLSLPLS